MVTSHAKPLPASAAGFLPPLHLTAVTSFAPYPLIGSESICRTPASALRTSSTLPLPPPPSKNPVNHSPPINASPPTKTIATTAPAIPARDSFGLAGGGVCGGCCHGGCGGGACCHGGGDGGAWCRGGAGGAWCVGACGGGP